MIKTKQRLFSSFESKIISVPFEVTKSKQCPKDCEHKLKVKKEYCTVYFYFANKNYAALLTYSNMIST